MNHRRTLLVVTALLVLGVIEVQSDVRADKRSGKAVTKYVRFQAGTTTAYGIVRGAQVEELAGDFGAWKPAGKTHALKSVKLLVPATPTKVLAMAGNYQSHLGEKPPFKNPEFFFKPASCLVPDGASIVLPADSTDVHFEAELVIVIGKRARNVPVEKAGDYVLGVTCGNDISERVWQKGDVQWWRAKGSDTFGPCGPWIVSGLDNDNLLLKLRVNGEQKQNESTKDMVHNVAQSVAWASRHVTLEPGDLIFTGTPQKSSALKPGDVVEVEIEGIGILRNPVVAEKP